MSLATATFRLRLSFLIGGFAFFAILGLLHSQPVPVLAILAGISAWSAVITLGVLWDAIHSLRSR